MNSLLLQICMLISFPAESLPELERIATELNITIVQAAERVIIERIKIPGFYYVLSGKEVEQEEAHPYY